MVAIVAFFVLSALACAGCKRSESRHSPDEPKAGGAGMNVLLVSVDTTRADHLACYGHPKVKTPEIDRFAAEGTRFAMCISSAPLTLPSHATMLTGSYPFIHGARDNGIFVLNDNNETLPEVFGQAGYATYAEVAAIVLNHKYGLNQGFQSYGDIAPQVMAVSIGEDAPGPDPDGTAPPAREAEKPAIETDRKAKEITDRGIELLTGLAQSDKPFFLFLHYFDPHWPHEAPARFASQYDSGYLAEIAYFDEQFGRLMEAVRSLGLGKRTLVVLTSDHGEGLGQHGEYTHSAFLYDTTLHVPLVLWCPGHVPAGQVIETQVRLVDIAPTITDFARLDRTSQMQGVSLMALLEDPKLELELPCYSDTLVPKHSHNYAPLRSLRTDEWKYILSPHPELYHVAEDRMELINLAATKPDHAAWMRDALREIIAQAPTAPGGRGTRKTIDEEELSKLQALGYVGAAVQGPDRGGAMSGTELDDFEPVGANPREHIEEIEYISTGMGALRVGRYDVAERFLRRLIELDPNHPEGYHHLAMALMHQHRNDEAIAAFRKAIELVPDRASDHRPLGALLVMRGEYAEAEVHFRKAVELEPDNHYAHMDLGWALAYQRRFEDALVEYAVAVELDPQSAGARAHQGIARAALGRSDEAIDAFRAAIDLDPTLVLAHIRLAGVLRRAGRASEAIEQLVRAAELAPESTDALFALASHLDAAGKRVEARDVYERVLAAAPRSDRAYLQAANLLDRLGDGRGALGALRRGLVAMPEQPAITNDLAWRLATSPQAELRDGAEAVRLAEQANAIRESEDAGVLDTLAAAYAEVGRFDEAVRAAKRAVEIARGRGDTALAGRISTRLTLYESRKPYREP